LEFGGLGNAMPLTQDKITGYDTTRMVFKFTMLNNGETVQCEISSAALDELAGGRGTALAGREDLFMSHRLEIERVASVVFGSSSPVRGAIVRIFAKHIRR
jgi:hypothetical protein